MCSCSMTFSTAHFTGSQTRTSLSRFQATSRASLSSFQAASTLHFDVLRSCGCGNVCSAANDTSFRVLYGLYKYWIQYFIPLSVETSGRLYDDFIRLLFWHTHREAFPLTNELPEESDQIRFLRVRVLLV